MPGPAPTIEPIPKQTAETSMPRTLVFLATLLTTAAVLHAGVGGIARIPDPPPPVDGSMERLATSPTSFSWDRPENVVFGADKWTGPTDLSGQLFLGWDANHLYIAALVVDETVTQPYYGRDVYKGDHLEVFLDVPRRDPASRSGKKLYQIGLSPGNFAAGEAHIPPEIVKWSPTLGVVEGARIAARRTEDGYRIEAALPWRSLDVTEAKEGLCLGVDVTLSDADAVLDSGQETMCSLLTDAWDLRDPNRMLEAALGDSAGKVAPETIKSGFKPLVTGLRVPSGGDMLVDVSSVDSKAVKEVIVRARIDTETIAGGTQCLGVEANGTRLGLERIRNRLKRFDMGARKIGSHSGTGWFIFYAPDFKPAGPSSSYHVRGIHPYELRFDVSDLWKTEGNTLRLLHSQPTVKRDIVADVSVSETLSPKLLPPKPKLAPTGPIPTFEPAGPARPAFSFTCRPDGMVCVTLGEREWVVRSKFSTTAPGWVELTDGGRAVDTPHYRVRRTVTKHADRLHVSDRITNTSDEDQPVMVRHSVDAGADLRSVGIGGLNIEAQRYQVNQGSHPASVALYEDAGIGLLSEDDLMRSQAMNCRHGNVIGIHNDRLVVARGSTVELEFSIYPLEKPDTFALINRIRRNWGTNFTIPGSFAFMKQRAPVTKMTDEQFKAHLEGKSARFICSSMGYYNGVWAHGTSFKHTDPSAENELFARARRLMPAVKTFFYLHCYISVHEDDKATYAADRLLRPDGSQADYRDAKYPIFIPREGSAFAKAQDELIDLRFEALDLDGIYWDEIAYSAYMYDYSDLWDGLSAAIDPQSHRITRKIANVTLATLPWRLRAAKRMLARGMLIGNGAPLTRTFTKLQFPRFIETGSISNLTKGQLYTPIALGDHLTERTPVDCYRNMLDALDYGAVYYWYHDQIVATEPTFTSVMFPITPIELGPGYVIGRERILTNRSGCFGWGDANEFEAVVFDDQGKRTDKVNVPRVTKDGKVYAEVRIPDGFGAALIRR